MNKKILVTGGTGMIGRFLVDMLLKQGNKIKVVSLDNHAGMSDDIEFIKADLRDLSNCIKICKGMDEVYHLVGIKGSPKITLEHPANFYFSTVSFNTNMLEAAYRSNVDRYLFTSSVGVYSPAPLLKEDDVWKTFPSVNDKYSGWSKRMGELQIEAYRIEYGWDNIAIVRPANVYGPYDNFDLNSSMVVPSLIRKAVNKENPFVVWGDGSAIRDFIYAKDVAAGILRAMEVMSPLPINLGSGKGVSIRELVNTIVDQCGNEVDIQWDTSKPEGDKSRVLDMSRAKKILGFEASTLLKDGIKQTLEWYINIGKDMPELYNVFKGN